METLTVDMLAEARNAQLGADELLGPGALRVVAPAKVNLILSVGGRRDDGLHAVTTVMHALALHDTLHFKLDPRPWKAELGGAELPAQQAAVGPEGNVLVTVLSADKTQPTVRALDIPAADNLAVRALDALARAAGRTAEERITMHIEKQIPAQAGLGGGSADAAAALLAGARLWGLPTDGPLLPQEEASGPTLHQVAASLGVDVAFFLDGGCALMEGAGEQIRARLEPAKLPVVLVKAPEGVSTAQAYAAFDEHPTPTPPDLLAKAESAKAAAAVPLFNNLAPAAEGLVPQLAEAHTWLADQLGEGRVLLCGSGSCTFALADSFAQASRISAAAQARGWWSRPTTLSRLRATVT